MYFTYIMEIIDATECDLIPMYCNNFEKSCTAMEKRDNKYILTTKILLSVKGKQEKPEGLMKVLDMLNSSIGKTKDAPASGSTPAS